MDRAQGTSLRLLKGAIAILTGARICPFVAVPRGPDGVDHLRDTKRSLWRTKPHAIANAERESDADSYYRVEHRRSLP